MFCEQAVAGNPGPLLGSSRQTSTFSLNDAKYWETGRIVCHYKGVDEFTNLNSVSIYLYVKGIPILVYFSYLKFVSVRLLAVLHLLSLFHVILPFQI
jgi:hypothetical protein